MNDNVPSANPCCIATERQVERLKAALEQERKRVEAWEGRAREWNITARDWSAKLDSARADVGAMQAELAAMGARNLATSYDRDAQIAELRASLAAARDVLREAASYLSLVRHREERDAAIEDRNLWFERSAASERQRAYDNSEWDAQHKRQWEKNERLSAALAESERREAAAREVLREVMTVCDRECAGCGAYFVAARALGAEGGSHG